MPDISVIIVNWNSKEFVKKCVLSLCNNHGSKELEIIVVDNGSFDGCGDELLASFHDVVFLQLRRNIGFGQANNAGFERARADILWLLNPDTEVVGGAADELFSALNTQKEIGLVGARLLNSDGSLQTSCVQSLPTAFNQAFDSEILRERLGIWGMSAFRSNSKLVEVEAVSGACMMIRRVDFRNLGCFDARYFMYCEDMDLCFAVRKRGLKVIYVPNAVIIHHGGQSASKQASRFSIVMVREALMQYFLKNNGILSAICYRVLLAISTIVRLIVLLLLKIIGWRFSKNRSDSIKKWLTILNWCIGGERWAKSLLQS